MQGLLNFITRYMPLLFAIMVLVMVSQFIGKLPVSGFISSATIFFTNYAIYILVLSGICWFLVFSAVLYSNEMLPEFMQKGFFMDVLDRLTNKEDVEKGVQQIEEEVYIDAEALAKNLKQKIIGQDEVCEDVAAQIRRRLALIKRGKPVGIFLLAGPPGTGKTYLAKNLASELERELLHFDMSQFASGSHSLSQLFGMTKGYVGSDSYGKLTAGLRDTPKAVVLLDEIEKAHPDVMKSFLTAWNDGFITERSDGQAISTTSAIFVLTSNAATDRLTELYNIYVSDPDAMRSAAIETLKEAQFAPEVLNRIDRVFVFRKLEGLDVARVTALEIEMMIQSYGLEVDEKGIDPQIILALMARYNKLGKSSSSRDLVRSIEEKMADSLIEAKKCGIEKITLIQSDDGTIKAEIVKDQS